MTAWCPDCGAELNFWDIGNDAGYLCPNDDCRRDRVRHPERTEPDE